MTWKEGQPKPSVDLKEKENGASSPVKGKEEVEVEKAGQEVEEGGKDLKRKSLDRNESSILEPLSPKRIKETPSVCPSCLSFLLIRDLSSGLRTELIGSHHLKPRNQPPHQNQHQWYQPRNPNLHSEHSPPQPLHSHLPLPLPLSLQPRNHYQQAQHLGTTHQPRRHLLGNQLQLQPLRRPMLLLLIRRRKSQMNQVPRNLKRVETVLVIS